LTRSVTSLRQKEQHDSTVVVHLAGGGIGTKDAAGGSKAHLSSVADLLVRRASREEAACHGLLLLLLR